MLLVNEPMLISSGANSDIHTPDSKPGAPVWNRTVTLRDSWAKIAGKKPIR